MILDKDKLKSYRHMQIEINTLEKRIGILQKKLNSPKYKALSEESIDRINIDETFKNLIGDLDDKCVTVNKLLSHRKKQVAELEQKLDALDPVDRTVITLYYIDCIGKSGAINTWNDVADLISYSLRRTQDIHKRALKKLSVM